MPSICSQWSSFCDNSPTSRKPVRCTEKLLKIKFKLILISFTFFVEYAIFFFFFVIQNVVGKVDK
jgi:hypothetical protein